MTQESRRRSTVWIALVLMLLAMAGYVLSLDDSDPQAVPDAVEQVEDTH